MRLRFRVLEYSREYCLSGCSLSVEYGREYVPRARLPCSTNQYTPCALRQPTFRKLAFGQPLRLLLVSPACVRGARAAMSTPAELRERSSTRRDRRGSSVCRNTFPSYTETQLHNDISRARSCERSRIMDQAPTLQPAVMRSCLCSWGCTW